MLSTKELDIPFVYFTLYIVTAFVITMLSLLLLYVACSRKYRLNWYEKNLLESVIKSKISSETSSIQSFHPSMENISVKSHDKILSNTPLIGTENVHVTLEEQILSSTQATNNYSVYPQTLFADTSDSPQEFSSISTGVIHLMLLYDITAGILTVRIVEANHLRATESNGTANPYAKIRLLPHYNNVWQTRVHKRTLNPVFDEDFVFEVSPQKIQEHTVEVILCDFNAYSRHRNIGNIQLPLKTLDLNQQASIWKELKPYLDHNKKLELGDLLISLAYHPLEEQLRIVIIKARNLKIVDECRTSSDPFIKISLISNGKKIKKEKTSFHRNTVSPLFNESLSFSISQEKLKHCCIEFKVLHDNLLGSNELLGCCIIGGDIKYCRSNERQIFAKLIQNQVVSPQWISLIDKSYY